MRPQAGVTHVHGYFGAFGKEEMQWLVMGCYDR